jgi:hypothetical protein
MPTKELVTEVQPKTFKAFEEITGSQEYHYLHRVVGPIPLPDGTLSGDMLDLEVMNWLQGGYRIAEVHFLGQHKGVDGNVHGYVYGYHLVRG